MYKERHKYVLACDPSGDGVSGFCLLDDGKPRHVSELKRKEYVSDTDYWNAHLNLIKNFVAICRGQVMVVLEDFLLNPKKASQFAGSRMDTSKLIGIIQHHCDIVWHVPYTMVKPVDHLSRFPDNVMCKLNIIKQTRGGYSTETGEYLSSHTKDALRLAIYYDKIYNINRNYKYPYSK